MLKMIDTGLMATHLAAHEGVIKRLEYYHQMALNTQLIQVISQQIGMMQNHVNAMTHLLNPNLPAQSNIPPVPMPQNEQNPRGQQLNTGNTLDDKHMALDAHFTAQMMANENFMSASQMQDEQVKQMHKEMAMQNATIAGQYQTLIKQNMWAYHPAATPQAQMQTIQQYSHAGQQNPMYQ